MMSAPECMAAIVAVNRSSAAEISAISRPSVPSCARNAASCAMPRAWRILSVSLSGSLSAIPGSSRSNRSIQVMYSDSMNLIRSEGEKTNLPAERCMQMIYPNSLRTGVTGVCRRQPLPDPS